MFSSGKFQGEIVEICAQPVDDARQIFKIPKGQTSSHRPASLIFLTAESNPQLETHGLCALRITSDQVNDLYIKIGDSVLKSVFNGNQGWFELLGQIPGELKVRLKSQGRGETVLTSKFAQKNDLSGYISERPEYAATTKYFLEQATRNFDTVGLAQIETYFDALVTDGKQIQIFSGAAGTGKTNAVESIARVLGSKVHAFNPHEPIKDLCGVLHFDCEKYLLDPNFSLFLEQFIDYSEAEGVLSVIECRDLGVLHPKLQKKFPTVKFRGFSNQSKRDIVLQRLTGFDHERLELGLKITRSEPGASGLLQFLAMAVRKDVYESIDARLRLPQGVQVVGINIESGFLHSLQATYTPGPTDQLSLSGGMEESFQSSVACAFQFLKTHLQLNGGMHVHICGGLGKKGGVSAGAGAALAIYLAVTKGTARLDTAILGEITLFGEILPVGGIPEKILAASRHGVKRIFLPIGNKYETSNSTDCELIFVETFKQITDVYFND